MPRISILAELPLNHRERIQAALKFEEPDRVPCHETPRDLTLAAWHEPGMPRDVPPADYFGFDLTSLYLDLSPRLEQRVLQREDGMITCTDRFGYTVAKAEGVSSTMHSDHSCPPEATFDQYSWRHKTAQRIFEWRP